MIFEAKGHRKRRERGVCRLDRRAFGYSSPETEFEIPIEDMPALAFSCGTEFEVYHNDELYYFYPEKNGRQTVRWALAVDMLKEEEDRNERIG